MIWTPQVFTTYSSSEDKAKKFGNNISKYISLLKLVLIVMDIMQQNGIYATHIFRHSRSNVLYRQGAVAVGRCAAVITLVASVNLASTALTITTWRDWTTEASWLVRCATRNVTGHHVFFNPLRKHSGSRARRCEPCAVLPELPPDLIHLVLVMLALWLQQVSVLVFISTLFVTTGHVLYFFYARKCKMTSAHPQKTAKKGTLA
ncbi:hypothetical protein CB1_000406010 [Camelus ferus]|nr:hypothetical protein CB1_000406010 [Camelus ferus]